MSTPLDIDAVGLMAMQDGFEAVSLRVVGRVQTVVVARGHGEPLARLLLAGDVVAAARELIMAASSTPPGRGRAAAFVPALGRLARAIETLDSRPLGHEVVPLAVDRVEPPGMRHDVRPGEVIEATIHGLYGGDESIFRAVAVAGVVLAQTPDGPKPIAYGMSAVDETSSPEAYRPLAAQLRELADGIDHQFVITELARSKAVRTCRSCACTDDDCSQCIAKTGEPCHWVAADLCSACPPDAHPEVER